MFTRNTISADVPRLYRQRYDLCNGLTVHDDFFEGKILYKHCVMTMKRENAVSYAL